MLSALFLGVSSILSSVTRPLSVPKFTWVYFEQAVDGRVMYLILYVQVKFSV
jgi:hypothetical protein